MTRLDEERAPSPWRVNTLVGLMCLTILTGCASLDRRQQLAGPPALHQGAEDRFEAAAPDKEAPSTEELVAARYYAALRKASGPEANRADVDRYVDEGIELVKLDCLRWFARLEEQQRAFQARESDRNVITQLGTALIGIAKLHPDVTAVYGGLNTAFNGINNTFSSFYLAAPNAEDVKLLTLTAIESHASQMRQPSSVLYVTGFSSAYVQLERLANICTYAEVKRLSSRSVAEAVAGGSVTTNPQTGVTDIKVNVKAVESAATIEQARLQPRISALLAAVRGLSDDRAIKLANEPPFTDGGSAKEMLKAFRSNDQPIADASIARRALRMLIVHTTATEDRVSTWEQAIQ